MERNQINHYVWNESLADTMISEDLRRKLIAQASFLSKEWGPPQMTIIAGSAVPICLLLIWVLVQFARGFDWHPLLLIFPMILYVGYVMLAAPNVNRLALSYLVFSAATLVVYTFLCLPYSEIRSYLEEKVSIAS